jgi:hypothetical protein
MSDENKAALCSGATNDTPSTCAGVLHEANAGVKSGSFMDIEMQEETIVNLCRGAADVGPALCYLQAPKELGKEQQAELCEGSAAMPKDERGGAARSAAAVCAAKGLEGGLDKKLVVRLCRGRRGEEEAAVTGPVDCAITVPFGFSPGDLVMLCSGAENSVPGKCAKAVDANFATGMRAKVRAACERAGDVTARAACKRASEAAAGAA